MKSAPVRRLESSEREELARHYPGAMLMRGIIERLPRIALAVIAIVLASSTLLAAGASLTHRMIGQEEATRLGLTRAWFTQARVDAGRNHVERAILTGNRLTVLTSAGIVQEIDALTGRTYWVAPIGKENYPSLGPTGNDKFIAIVNGSTLYVLDRADGKPVLVRSVGGAPGAAPALAEQYVFVPLVSGRVEAYPIEGKKLTPWYYQSYGRAMVPPLVTPQSIVWTTDAGYLYVGNSNEPSMRFRLETGSDIVAQPGYRKPYVYLASMNGNLFAMNESTGTRLWKYSTGFPIMRAPAAVGDRVFITSAEPALHCVDALTGNGVWEAPHVVQFAAISKDRVYGVDDLEAFVVLNAANGSTIARIASDQPIHSLVNDQTDRVYLVSDDGMVECLHEIALTQPIRHVPKVLESKEKEKVAPSGKSAVPAAKPTGGTEKAQPKAKPAVPMDEEDKKPAKKGEAATDDNPFGT
jgi:outer membrane protein assembly factor BamB